MCPLSNNSGSKCDLKVRGEAGSFTEAFAIKDYSKDLIAQANSVPLISIFKYYNVKADEHNRKIICPFKSHKGGRENTPSFHYYPDSNSFRCYGCNTGGPTARSCEFVAAMEKINKVKAAEKVLQLFASDVDENNICNVENFSERTEIMIDFSNTVRDFRQAYIDEKSQEFIEFICRIYDKHNLKYDHTNEALRHIVDQIKERIKLYKP